MTTATKLTQREIDAIVEALSARLADEIDGDGLQPTEVYQTALIKMRNRLTDTNWAKRKG